MSVWAGSEGVWTIPLATTQHARQGTRERLREVAARHPDRLHIELDALATRVVLDAKGRAVAVEYLKGARLYGATPDASSAPGTPCRIEAAKEVILCGGAFNTPQLLMLSGIGPGAELARHGIPLDVDLPGVGTNLQDRYEVGVVFRMVRDWAAMGTAEFRRGDALFKRWAGRRRRGMYISNGVAIGVSRRSRHASGPDADLWLMALLARFEGYATGYSKIIADTHDCLTWAILKGRTGNRSGTVRLASPDPRQSPRIDFNYFGEGGAADLAARRRRGAHRARPRRRVGRDRADRRRTDPRRARHRRTPRPLDRGSRVGPPCVRDCRNRAARGRRGARRRTSASTACRGLRVVDASVFPAHPGIFHLGGGDDDRREGGGGDFCCSLPSRRALANRERGGPGWGVSQRAAVIRCEAPPPQPSPPSDKRGREWEERFRIAGRNRSAASCSSKPCRDTGSARSPGFHRGPIAR